MHRTQDGIRGLERRLHTAGSPGDEIEVLAELGLAYRLRDAGMARTHAERALELLRSDLAARERYREEGASALLTLAFVGHLEGSSEEALAQIQEAVSLLEGLPASRTTCDAWISLAWTSAYAADYDHAFEQAARALAVSRECESRADEAMALDAFAAVSALSGDHREAIKYIDEALDVLRELGDPDRLCYVLNNRATTLLSESRYQEALADGEESLRLAQREGLTFQERNVVDTLAQILIEMGDYAEAERRLSRVVREFESLAPSLFLVYGLVNLGQACLGLADAGRAEELLLRARDVAESVGVPAEEARCHWLLSRLYADQARWREAYEHLSVFLSIEERVRGKAIAARLNVLKVTHQVETAERDAEIHRMKGVALEREIEERKRLQADLEVLATSDPLTGLLNRRSILSSAEREVERASRQGHAIAVLMIDIDRFKRVNDTHGHAIGDEALRAVAAAIRDTVRAVDALGRFGGEEFVAVLPGAPEQKALEAARRICRGVAGKPIVTNAGELRLTVSIGVAGMEDVTDRGVELDQLLGQADIALYEAKRRGRNRAVLHKGRASR